MTAPPHEAAVWPDLLSFLEERGIPHEVVDGSVVVNPPPGTRHERVVAAVLAQLWQAAPAGIDVVGSNLGFWYDGPSYLTADVTVVRAEDLEERGTSVPPLLVVEVLSQSTRRRDVLGKWSVYAAAGVPSYWLVDPVEPLLRVLTLIDGLYVETARVTGDEPLTVEQPFPVTLRLQRP